MYKPIKEWADDERPREKLIKQGAATLSNAELLAILINTGTKQRSALEIAQELLALCNQNFLEFGKLSLSEIKKIKGLGEKKAVTLKAAIELGRRKQFSEALITPKIQTSKQAFDVLVNYFSDATHELFCVLYLNNARYLVHSEIISTGGITSTVVDVRLILKKALSLHGVTKLFIAHNHPSGISSPSPQDIALTQKIKQAALVMDIELIDHLILFGNSYYSFNDSGKM